MDITSWNILWIIFWDPEKNKAKQVWKDMKVSKQLFILF